MITNNQTIVPKSRIVARGFVLGPSSLRLLTIALFVALSLFYLAQTTQGATKTYEINNLSNQEAELNAQAEQLAIDATRARGAQNINNAANELTLEPIKEIEALEIK